MPKKQANWCVNSMVSGPTNSRCSGTIGSDRGGTAFGSKHRENRCIGLELAYKRWSLTIAEDWGQPDILGVTLRVTGDARIALPRGTAFCGGRASGKTHVTTLLRLSGFGFEFAHQVKRIARIATLTERKRDCLRRYRPNPVSGHPEIVASKRPFSTCGKLRPIIIEPSRIATSHKFH
jgi:hypothetical protein